MLALPKLIYKHMAAQPPGVARTHIGGGTELVPDIAKSPDEPT